MIYTVTNLGYFSYHWDFWSRNVSNPDIVTDTKVVSGSMLLPSILV